MSQNPYATNMSINDNSIGMESKKSEVREEVDIELDTIKSFSSYRDEPRTKQWARWLEIDDLDALAWTRIEAEHPEEEQVLLDVERSFVFYPEGDTKVLRKDLLELCVQVLRKHPYLKYYQGYHDIAQIVLLVCGLEKSLFIMEKLSLLYLRDFMLPTISPSLEQLNLIPGILEQYDSEFAQGLTDSYGPTPYFALSPILTLFAHHIKSFDSICRFYDEIFKSRSMATPLYIYASLILHNSTRLKPQLQEFDNLYSSLTNLVDDLDDNDVEVVFENARSMAGSTPLSQLKEWDSISKYSVLKNESFKSVDDEVLSEMVEKQSQEPQVEVTPVKSMEKPPGSSKAHKNPDSNNDGVLLSIGICAIAAIAYYYMNSSDY